MQTQIEIILFPYTLFANVTTTFDLFLTQILHLASQFTIAPHSMNDEVISGFQFCLQVEHRNLIKF